MRYLFEAETSYEIDELITIMPPNLFYAIERPAKNPVDWYDGAAYNIIATIDVAPAVSLENLKEYMGKVWKGERMVSTVRPLKPEDELGETVCIYPPYVF